MTTYHLPDMRHTWITGLKPIERHFTADALATFKRTDSGYQIECACGYRETLPLNTRVGMGHMRTGSGREVRVSGK